VSDIFKRNLKTIPFAQLQNDTIAHSKLYAF